MRRFIPAWDPFRAEGTFFTTQKKEGLGGGGDVFFYKGLCLHGTEQSHAFNQLRNRKLYDMSAQLSSN